MVDATITIPAITMNLLPLGNLKLLKLIGWFEDSLIP